MTPRIPPLGGEQLGIWLTPDELRGIRNQAALIGFFAGAFLVYLVR